MIAGYLGVIDGKPFLGPSDFYQTFFSQDRIPPSAGNGLPALADFAVKKTIGLYSVLGLRQPHAQAGEGKPVNPYEFASGSLQILDSRVRAEVNSYCPAMNNYVSSLPDGALFPNSTFPVQVAILADLATQGLVDPGITRRLLHVNGWEVTAKPPHVQFSMVGSSAFFQPLEFWKIAQDYKPGEASLIALHAVQKQQAIPNYAKFELLGLGEGRITASFEDYALSIGRPSWYPTIKVKTGEMTAGYSFSLNQDLSVSRMGLFCRQPYKAGDISLSLYFDRQCPASAHLIASRGDRSASFEISSGGLVTKLTGGFEDSKLADEQEEDIRRMVKGGIGFGTAERLAAVIAAGENVSIEQILAP
ncbi:hypothetical protein HYY74_05990 [Candidatus Woesearchaeota archaeon]|nr:hypothetical protein [Candidatus Woesearchaeota archaeon]